MKVTFKACTTAVLLILLFFPQITQAQEQINLSLEEAIELALEHNREIRIAKYGVEAAESGVKEVTGGFLPEISVSAQYNRNVKKPVIFLGGGFPGMEGGPSSIEVGSNNSYQASLSATMPVYSRQLFKAREAAMLNQELSETDLLLITNNVIANVKTAYYSALLTEEVVEITELRVRNAEEQFETTKRLFEEGLATEYDLLVAEVQLENLRPELLQAQDDAEITKLQLKQVVGIVDAGPVHLSDELSPVTLYAAGQEEMLNTTLRNNLQLQLLENRLSILKTNTELERSALYPTLSAFGNYSYQTEDDTFKFSEYDWVNSAAIGLSIQVPIFAGNSRRERITQAEISIKQAMEETEMSREAIVTEVRSASNRLEQIKKRLDATEQALKQAERAYELSVLRFEEGLGTQVEINDSELAFATSRFNHLQAEYDYQIALTTLQQLQGSLIRGRNN